MGVKVRPQIVCPYCHYRQNTEEDRAPDGRKKKRRTACKKCGRSLKGVKEDWWLFIDHAGRKKAKKMKSKEAAEDVAKKTEAKLTLGEFKIEVPEEPVRKIPTFKEYAEKWIKAYVDDNLSWSTQNNFRNLLNKHIYPVIASPKSSEYRVVYVKKAIC